MARIYLKLPQCISLQELPGPRQLLILTCAALVVIILVILYIHSYYLDDTEATSPSQHFLPTVQNGKPGASYFSYGPNVHYGIVLDCGSSGTRVYVYIWPPHSGNPKDLLSIQQLKDQFNQPVVKKVTPGLDTFADHPEDASDYLFPLLKFAASHIPPQQHKETLLYILATAGMRLLSEEEQKAILQDLQRDIPKDFDFVIAENNFEVISGKQEGVYAWIAANYALQKFGHGDEDRYEHPLVAVDITGENGNIKQHVRRRTVGMIDMGGGSMQIAYEITANIDSVPKHLIAEFNLGCQSFDMEHTYRVYVTTFLGFGANEARSRYEEQLIKKIAKIKGQDQIHRPSSEDVKRGIEDLDVVKMEPGSHAFKQTAGSHEMVLVKQQNKTAVSANNDHEIIAGQLFNKLLHGRTSGEKRSALGKKSITGGPSHGGKSSPLHHGITSRPSHRGIRSAPGTHQTITDPCLQNGLTLQAREPEYRYVNFTGTGNYYECKNALTPLLNSSIPCHVMPCSINGVHQPTISYHNSQFYGFSEFWYTMEDVFRIGGLYEHDIFENHANDFCEQKWSTLTSQYDKKLYPKAGLDRFRMECFKAAWMTTVLHEGLHFPGTYKGLQSVQFINNRDVQWTLGALIHRTRYLPLREIQEHLQHAKFKPGWLNTSHILYNEYLLIMCFIIVVTAICIYIRRLKLCSAKTTGDLSRVPSMSYFMTDMDQVEQGVRLMKDYSYPER